MDELNELENSKSLNAIRIRKAYIAYLTQEVKEIDEKLKDETLSEDEKSQLTEQKKALEESARKVYSIKNPTEEEIAGLKIMLNDLFAKNEAKLNDELAALKSELDIKEKEYQEVQEQIEKLEENIPKASELKDFQEFLRLRSKAVDYKKQQEKGITPAEKDKQIKWTIDKLASTYPEICGLDKMPQDTSDLDILKNQNYAINFEIERMKKAGKDTAVLEKVSKVITKFTDSREKARVKAIKEEELDFKKNNTTFLIKIANEAAAVDSVAHLNEKIAKLQGEVDNLREYLKDSEAMLVVNADETSKIENLKAKANLDAKEAELEIYLDEIKFRDLPEELHLSDEEFVSAINERRARLENLPEPGRIQEAKEIQNLEDRHKELYGHDFAKEYQELVDKISKFKNQQETHHQEMAAYKAKKKDIDQKIDYISDGKQTIKDYDMANDIINNLNTLKAKAIENFQGKEFTSEDIKKFLEAQEEFKVLKDNPDKDKIEDLLVNEVTNACKKQKATNPRKDLKAFAKAAAVVASGFATGMVLSCVPGVGQVRMLAAGLKLAGNVIDKGINIYNSKHQDKKPIRTISQVLDAGINNLPPKIQNGLKFIKEKLSNKNVNLFINGVSAGYITGNVVELVTGKTVLQNIGDKFKSANATPESIAQASGTSSSGTGNGASSSNSSGAASSSTQSKTPKVPELNIPTDAITSLNIGEVYDLSNIPQGYIASGSEKAVNLITQAGKKAILDKTVTVNGKVWCSFLQPDGKGYAWIPEDVVKSLGKVATEVGKGITR